MGMGRGDYLAVDVGEQRIEVGDTGKKKVCRGRSSCCWGMLTERGASDCVDGYFPSWFKRASFVRVRDLRDPAASAAVARAERNGAS